MEIDTNKTVKTNMNDTLIMTYGLSNKQNEVLKKEFDNVKDVTDNFYNLIEVPAAAVVIDWDKLSDDEIKTFTEEFIKDRREFNTCISILSNYHKDDICVLHTPETECGTLKDTIDVIKERLSIPERFNDAKNRMKNTIDDIKKAIEEPAKNLGFEDQILMINKGCYPYENITKITNYIQESNMLKKVPYRIELNCVLNAAIIALGLLKIDDVDFRQASFSLNYEDDLARDYIINLAEMIKSHYEQNLKKNGTI